MAQGYAIKPTKAYPVTGLMGLGSFAGGRLCSEADTAPSKSSMSVDVRMN